jgi:hypothetical protein
VIDDVARVLDEAWQPGPGQSAAVYFLAAAVIDLNALHYSIACIGPLPDVAEATAALDLSGNDWSVEAPMNGVFLVTDGRSQPTNARTFSRREININGATLPCALPVVAEPTP